MLHFSVLVVQLKVFMYIDACRKKIDKGVNILYKAFWRIYHFNFIFIDKNV